MPLLESADDVVFVYRLQPLRCEYISPSILRLVGYGPDAHYADPELSFRLTHPDDRAILDRAVADPESHPVIHVRLIARDGHIVWTEQRATLARDEAGKPSAVIGIMRDVSGPHRSEQRLARLASFYAALSESNQAIVRCRTQEELFPALCRVAVENLSLIGAWIVLLEPETGRVVPTAGFGIGRDYLPRIVISIDSTVSEGLGPTGAAIREGRAHVAPDFLGDPRLSPWHDVARAAGVQSSASIPIRRQGHAIGALNLYAGERGFFDGELIALLEELATDISYALDNLAREASHREAEARVRASESKYRALFEAARDAIFLIDGDRIVDCNAATGRLFGASVDAVIGSSPMAFSPAVQPDGERSHDRADRYLRAAAGGEPQEFEWRHVTSDGVALDTEVVLTPVEIGGQRFVQAIVHDITERKVAEAQTASQAARYRSLMQAALDGIHILDHSGRLIEANDRFYELLGYDPADPPTELRVTDWDPTRETEASFEAVGRDLLFARTFETLHRRADGTVFPAEVSAIGVTLDGERRLYCASRDITARRRAEEERVSLQRSLLQAQKMESVGRLAGGVAHDFNNLLTVISGYASLLQADTAAQPALAARAGEIVKATARATELTRKLLIFSRRHPDEPKLVALDDFVRQEARMVPRLIGEHISVVCSPQAGPARVKVDPAQLAQVLMNLVVNASDAMPDGGTLTLRTLVERVDEPEAARRPGAQAGEYVVLAVADTGCGMDASVLAHLFEPFFTTKEVGKGTGLGLATVYGIVKQAGGFLEVQSAPGHGTAMRVFLPRADGAEDAPVQERAHTVIGGRERVLVVEDETMVRELTRTFLEQLGYTVLEATSPAEALAITRAGARFDLVLTDVVMPGMNGPRLVEELRTVRNGFEVLYMSGFADTGMASASAVTTDHARFLAKPFTPEVLARKVRELLDHTGGAA
ncbi:MAG: PAS domain S-box protein [Vicinamibacterales bacterium]